MKQKKTFDDAYARFKSADQNVAQLSQRLTDANVKRVQAGIDVAAIDHEIEEFTTTGNFDSKAGARLVARQQDASNLLSLLDRSIEHLSRELARAKVSVIQAETECLAVQTKFHSENADHLCREFLRTNAGQIQKIVRAIAMNRRCSNAPTVGFAEARNYGFNVNALFDSFLPQMVSAELGNDDAFHAACNTSDNTPIDQLHESKHVSASERAHARTGMQTPDGIVASIIKASEPVDEQPFDRAFAFAAARDAARQAEHHRQRAIQYEDSLKRAREKFGVLSDRKAEIESIEASMAMHSREADRYDDIVERWDTSIREHAA